MNQTLGWFIHCNNTSLFLGEMAPFVLLLSLFWLCCVTCRILVPQPGPEPTLSALESESYQLNCQGSPRNGSFDLRVWERPGKCWFIVLLVLFDLATGCKAVWNDNHSRVIHGGIRDTEKLCKRQVTIRLRIIVLSSKSKNLQSYRCGMVLTDCFWNRSDWIRLVSQKRKQC